MSLPVTEKIHNFELSIPMSPCLKDDEMEYVIKCLNEW